MRHLDEKKWMDIELDPQDWRSEREKPHEPFFGPGLPQFIFLVTLVLIISYIKG